MSYDDRYGGSLTSDPIPTMPRPEYPEHDKLAAVKSKSQTIGEFLDWLMNDRSIVLCTYHSHSDECVCTDNWHLWYIDDEEGPLRCPSCGSGGRRYQVCGMLEGYPNPERGSIQDWLALYFEIDIDALEREKRAMLETIRQGGHRKPEGRP